MPRFVDFGHNLLEMVSCGESCTLCVGSSKKIGVLEQTVEIHAVVTVILRFKLWILQPLAGKKYINELLLSLVIVSSFAAANARTIYFYGT